MSHLNILKVLNLRDDVRHITFLIPSNCTYFYIFKIISFIEEFLEQNKSWNSEYFIPHNIRTNTSVCSYIFLHNQLLDFDKSAFLALRAGVA